MNAPTRVAGFLLALAGIFALAVGAGNAVGPLEEPPASHDARPDPSPALTTFQDD